MTDSAVGELSERESSYLDHRRQAKAQGIGLAEHCRRHGLNVKAYYQIARDLADRQAMTRFVTSASAPDCAASSSVDESSSQHHATEFAILPSEIEQLPDLSGFVKLASRPEWMSIRMQLTVEAPARMPVP
jgi:hypothetical protein